MLRMINLKMNRQFSVHDPFQRQESAWNGARVRGEFEIFSGRERPLLDAAPDPEPTVCSEFPRSLGVLPNINEGKHSPLLLSCGSTEHGVQVVQHGRRRPKRVQISLLGPVKTVVSL